MPNSNPHSEDAGSDSPNMAVAQQRIENARESNTNWLDLSGLGINTLPESLGQLTGLPTLILSGNQLTTLPEWMGKLTGLKTLRLYGNQLALLPASLEKLTGLHTLDLGGNQLTALPEWLGQLTGLKTLKLSRNQLTMLPESLGQLTGLQSLDLASNQFTTLPEWLEQLTGLKTLMLYGNQLAPLPVTLGKLTGLHTLDLGGNQLTALPEWLGQLTELQSLLLHNNRLATLPESLGQLTGLKSLDLFGNQLTTLPECMGQLTELKRINLTGNHLTTLPSGMALWQKLERLNLDGRFLRADLSAVLRREGWLGLRNHLLLIEQGEDVLTGKLMLVGNGKVGKSCLLDALRGVKPRHERDTTHGMVREQLYIRLDGSLMDTASRRQLKGARQDVIDFQCWDMGGQEAYWTTHQMFFTPEALYVMAYHGREGIARGQVREWLTLIRNRATGRARVLLVATHCRKADSVTTPDLSSLDEEMQAMIVGFVAVDSFEPNGIEELHRQLAIHAQSNDYFKRRMLGGWTKFQTALAQVRMPFIKLEAIIKVSEQNGLSREAVLKLLQLAHDVGVLLWHHQNEELARFVVLHPDWLSQAVAYVLKYEPAKRANGIVSHHDLSQLWAAPPYPESQPYPTNVHSMLVALMEETEISYRLPVRAGNRNQAESSLIAQLVDRNPPPTWQSRWEQPMKGIHTEMVRLFSFLPPQGRKLQRLTGLVYRLIVRLHEYSLGRRDYTQAVHWQNGLLLSNDYGDLARIEFRDDDELEIRVRGLIPVSFMDRLRDTLREVVDDFWKGVTVREMAFCADHCPSGIKTGAFDVDLCRAELAEDETLTRCTVQACRKKVPILSLLSPPVEPAEVNMLRRLLEDRFSSLDEQVAMVQKTVTAVGAQMIAFQQILRDDIRSVMATLMDSGHDGPRLFSVKLLEPGFLDNPNWASTKLQVTLWCEHSHLPLCFLSAKSKTEGVYHIDVQKEWLIKAGKCLKFASRLVLYVKTLGLAGGLSEVSVDVRNSVLEDAETMHKIADILKPEENSLMRLDNVITSYGTLPEQDPQTLEDHGKLLEKGDAFAHWLRVQIKAKDPHFAGMKKVTDITGKVLWVHQKYLEHYQKPTPRME